MGWQLEAVVGAKGDRLLVVVQPQGELAFEHEAALFRAVVQVPFTAGGAGCEVAFEHGEATGNSR
ncbi:hypothetical protein D3C76_1419070 [compost metagenome]